MWEYLYNEHITVRSSIRGRPASVVLFALFLVLDAEAFLQLTSSPNIGYGRAFTFGFVRAAGTKHEQVLR